MGYNLILFVVIHIVGYYVRTNVSGYNNYHFSWGVAEITGIIMTICLFIAFVTGLMSIKRSKALWIHFFVSLIFLLSFFIHGSQKRIGGNLDDLFVLVTSIVLIVVYGFNSLLKPIQTVTIIETKTNENSVLQVTFKTKLKYVPPAPYFIIYAPNSGNFHGYPFTIHHFDPDTHILTFRIVMDDDPNGFIKRLEHL